MHLREAERRLSLWTGETVRSLGGGGGERLRD